MSFPPVIPWPVALRQSRLRFTDWTILAPHPQKQNPAVYTKELTHPFDALHLGTIGFDAVKHLLLCRIERRPPRLDLENYPHLPLADVHTTQAADYMTLLSTQASVPAETSAPEVTR
jgi:hypothetical protein